MMCSRPISGEMNVLDTNNIGASKKNKIWGKVMG